MDKIFYARWNSTEGLTGGDEIPECRDGDYGCEPAWDAGLTDGGMRNLCRHQMPTQRTKQLCVGFELGEDFGVRLEDFIGFGGSMDGDADAVEFNGDRFKETT